MHLDTYIYSAQDLRTTIKKHYGAFGPFLEIDNMNQNPFFVVILTEQHEIG